MKNKRNGFTLVELLAVIVILAVILVIAVPKILNVIEGAKRGAFENSVNLIVSSAKNYYAKSLLDGGISNEIVFTQNNGELVNGENKLEFSGMEVAGDSYLKLNSAGSVALSITDGVYYASKEFDEVGIVVTEEEGSALTREELSQELAELRAMVAGNTTSISNLTSSINENASDISELNGLFSTIQQTVAEQDNKFTALNSAIGTVKENKTLLATTPLPSGERTVYCEISLTPGTYVLYGWIRATGGTSASYISSSFSNTDFAGISPSETRSGTMHTSISSYVTVTSTKTVNLGAYSTLGLTITNCNIEALRIK